MIKHKFLTLFVVLCATTALWASNVITYTATEKLTSSTLDVGETTFGSAITSHDFSNGIGTITCDGEVTTIGELAFYECLGLTSVTIGNSVTTIGERAFSVCYGLTSVTFLGTACQNNIGVDAFHSVGDPDPALLTLPGNWTGTLPDENGNWYGGKFELSEVPTTLINVNTTTNANKFMHEGQLIIRKAGKMYNVLGVEVR